MVSCKFTLERHIHEYPHDKSRLQGLQIYMPVPKSWSVLQESPCGPNCGIEAFCLGGTRTLRAPHLGLWSLAAIINSSLQALLVHSPSPTAADLQARPHTGYWSWVCSLQLGTLLSYFWLKYFSHLIVLFFKKNHSSNFWGLTKCQALCYVVSHEFSHWSLTTILEHSTGIVSIFRWGNVREMAAQCPKAVRDQMGTQPSSTRKVLLLPATLSLNDVGCCFLINWGLQPFVQIQFLGEEQNNKTFGFRTTLPCWGLSLHLTDTFTFETLSVWISGTMALNTLKLR